MYIYYIDKVIKSNKKIPVILRKRSKYIVYENKKAKD